jgi:hypothetical protein
MKIGLNHKLLLCLAVFFATFAIVPAAFAQENPNLDKHARRIEKKLSKLHAGSFVEIDFRDNSSSLGSLGRLSATSFQITDADNNQTETFAYGEVAQVRKGKEYIGEGSEPGHRPRLIVPIVIAAAAAAAAVAVVETVR